MDDSAIFHEDGGGEGAFFGFGVGMAGECAGPGDVTVAGRVKGVGFLDKGPACAGVNFPKREIVLGDVLFGARETFLRGRELVHEGEAEVVFGGGEIDLEEIGTEVGSSFPADLAAKAAFIARTADGTEVLQEKEESGFEEVPIFSAGAEQGAKPEFGALGFVDVDDGEVALAGSGDVEAQAERHGTG